MVNFRAHFFWKGLAWCGWLLASGLGGIAPAFAEQDGLEEEFQLLEEEQMIFSAAKHQQDIAESPSAVTVITREQIENSFCSTLTCLLRFTQEMDVIQMRPMYTAVGARSLTGEFGKAVLGLVDGQEINWDLLGFALWESLPVHLEDVERVEIIRGPGSALYGATAYSAVISVISKKIQQTNVSAFIGGGEHNNQNLSLRADKVLGDWKLRVTASREIDDNLQLRDFPEREIHRLGLRADYESGSSSLTLEAGYSSPRGFVHAVLSPGQFQNPHRYHLAASFKNDWLSARLSGVVFDSALLTDIPMYFNGLKLGEMPEIGFVNSTLDSEVQTNLKLFANNLLIAGLHYRFALFSTEQNAPQDVFEHRLGLFLQDEQRLFENLIITAGLRVDYNSISPLIFSPRLAGVWRFAPEQHLRLGAGQAFRKPTLFESSVHIVGVKGISGIGEFFETNLGNDKLNNETVTCLEAGYLGRFLDSRLTVESDLFYNFYQDGIEVFTDLKVTSLNTPDLKNSVMEFRNLSQSLHSVGGSMSLTYLFRDTFRLNVNYTYRYSFYGAKGKGDSAGYPGQEGERVSWEPAHLFNLSGYYLFGTSLRLGLGVHGQSSIAGLVNQDANLFGAKQSMEAPASWFLSAFIAWRLNWAGGVAETGLRAYNALNLGFHDSLWFTRADGLLIGSEKVGRLIQVFLRTSI